MCIAIISEAGIDLPKKTVLKRCFTNNPDGAGYGVFLPDSYEWACKKGFMTFKSFWKSFNKEKFTKDDMVIIHFRIGTSGKKEHPDCTHPFPITDNEDKLIVHHFTSKNIAMHNGTCGDGRENLSDTMVAITDYIHPLLSQIEDPKILNIISKCIGNTSRWFIAKGEKYWQLGDWKKEESTGLWYSNNGYLPAPKPTIYSYTSNGYPWYSQKKEPIIKHSDSSKLMYYELNKWSWEKWDRLNTPMLAAPAPKPKVDENEGYEVYDDNGDLDMIIDKKGDIIWEAPHHDVPVDYSCPFCTNMINDEVLSSYGECPFCHEVISTPPDDDDYGCYCCPYCKEQDYLIEPPYGIGDTECVKCGAIFNDDDPKTIIGWSYQNAQKGGMTS